MNIQFRKVAFYNPQTLRNSLLFIMVIAFICISGTLYAQNLKPEGWYRLRTNSVPYQPCNVTVDSTGGVWVTAIDGTEDDPGVWYRPVSPVGGPFQYSTNDARNNLVSASSNPPVIYPQFTASVLDAARDKSGNTWYALKNRTVIVEKPDHTWVTFVMPDSSEYDYQVEDTTNVDSAHRIRFIDKPGGTQETLLIAYRGILRIDSGLSVVEERQVYSIYNNYFIQDALIDSQGRYWVADGYGLAMGTSLINTEYVYNDIENPNIPGSGPITYIEEDSHGNIWCGSGSYNSGCKIYCYTTGNVWNMYDLVEELGMPDSRVNSIEASDDGSVWFGGLLSQNGGLLRYMSGEGGEQWIRYRAADLGLQSEQIPGIAAAGDGLWFTTAYTPGVTGNGTGVHYLTFNEGVPNVTHYTYRGSSTTLTSLCYNYIAADKSGNVWFPPYDSPTIARLNADGAWTQFRQSGEGSFGISGFHGVAADSKNIVYFAPVNKPPLAYDVTGEKWIDLPAADFTEYYYYGLYVDPQDGKWFHCAYAIYYLDPDNTTWTSISTEVFPEFPSNEYTEGVLVDDAQNVWFMARYGVYLMKRDPDGGAPTWFKFVNNDDSGYSSGYRVYQDDAGQVWNANKQKYNPSDNTWATVTDTSAFDHRKMRFLNGTVSADMDLSEALEPVVYIDNYTGERTSRMDERNMTVDSRGTIYFTGGLGDVTAGIVAFGPLNGDLNKNGAVDLGDVILAAKALVDEAAGVSANGDVSGDLKIGIAEMIFTLQRISGLR